MKLKQLSVLCALVAAGVSGQAFAIGCGESGYDYRTCDSDVGSVWSGTNSNKVFFVGGASAPDGFLAGVFTEMLEPGYTVVNKGDSSYTAFIGKIKTSGTVNPIPASLQGKHVRIIKRSAGGSIYGINPIARNTAIDVLDTFSSNATCGAPSADGANLKATCTFATGNTRVPELGVSDVHPKLFKGTGAYNNEFNLTLNAYESALNSTELNTLNINATYINAMGLVATNSVPSSAVLSRATYGSMLTKSGYTFWSQSGITIPDVASAGDRDPVVVCRRYPGSGTQASYNWYFNNYPCENSSVVGSGNTTPLRQSEDSDIDTAHAGSAADPYVLNVGAPNTFGATVLELSGSGNVRDCLEYAEKGGVYSWKDDKGKTWKADFGTGHWGAIGVLSLDSLDNRPNNTIHYTAYPVVAGTTTQIDSTGAVVPYNTSVFTCTQRPCGWSFRMLDGAGTWTDSNTAAGAYTLSASAGATGIAPSVANLQAGLYPIGAETTFQYANALSDTNLSKTFAKEFISRVSDPAIVTATAFPYVSITPDVFLAAGGTDITGKNVAKGSRGNNMCAPIQYQF